MRAPLRVRYAAFTALGVFLLVPGVALAAEETSEGWGPWLQVGRMFNLALVIGILVYFVRKPMGSFFVNRTRQIREKLEEAQQARREAEAKLAEIESRMSCLDDELKEIHTAAEKEAVQERERLIAEAEKDAQKIIERAREEIAGMTQAAQIELKAHAAELSVQLAKDKIRSEITDEDQGRLFTRFVAKLGGRE